MDSRTSLSFLAKILSLKYEVSSKYTQTNQYGCHESTDNFSGRQHNLHREEPAGEGSRARSKGAATLGGGFRRSRLAEIWIRPLHFRHFSQQSSGVN